MESDGLFSLGGRSVVIRFGMRNPPGGLYCSVVHAVPFDHPNLLIAIQCHIITEEEAMQPYYPRTAKPRLYAAFSLAPQV